MFDRPNTASEQDLEARTPVRLPRPYSVPPAITRLNFTLQSFFPGIYFDQHFLRKATFSPKRAFSFHECSDYAWKSTSAALFEECSCGIGIAASTPRVESTTFSMQPG